MSQEVPEQVLLLNDLEIAQNFIREQDAVLVYFGADDCNVCKVLRPKIWEMFAERFPKIACAYVDAREAPDVAAQMQVLAVPTLVVFFDGREQHRVTRQIAVGALVEAIARPYQLFFE